MHVSCVRQVAGAAVLGTAAVIISLLVAPAAQAAFPGYTYFIRPANFVDPTGTRGNAQLEVESDGVHVHVGDPSALAAASFTIPGGGVPLADFNIYGYHVNYGWSGTAAQPGVHYDIDLNGDGRPDLELVGEHVYGDDMWLNPDLPSSPTVPARTIRKAAPCKSDNAQHTGLRDGCSTTYGSTFHGRILDWRTGLADSGYPDATVTRGGFVATGGVIDGTLSYIGFGIVVCKLTTDPPVPADLTIAVDPRKTTAGSVVDVSGEVSNTYNYPHVVLQEKDPGGGWHTVAEQTFTTGSHYGFTVTPAGIGRVRYRTEVPASTYNTDTVTEPVSVKVTKG